MSLRVWIDTDPAILHGNGEVDDGYALLQAMKSPELDIVGISAVFGNTEIVNTYAMAQDIVGRTNNETIPVYRGHGQAADRRANPATEALRAAVADGPLTIIALGPLSNIAAALCEPGADLSNVKEIVFVGGRRVGLEFRATEYQETPFRDLNFELDPHAAKDLLLLGVPITFAGWEVSSQMWLTDQDLQKLCAQGDTTTRWLAEGSQDWLRMWTEDFSAPGFTPFDTLAVGWLLRPDLFETHNWPAEVIFTPERALLHADPAIDGAMVTYLRHVDNRQFNRDLMSRLLS